MGELKQNLIRDFKETVPYVLLSLFVAGGIVSLCLLFPETGLQIWLWLFALFMLLCFGFLLFCIDRFFKYYSGGPTWYERHCYEIYLRGRMAQMAAEEKERLMNNKRG